MTNTRVSHVEKNCGGDKLADNRCREGGEEMEVRKTKIAMKECIKSGLERVGE